MMIPAPVIGRTDETSIASSIIPYEWDDSRGLYLQHRACGLSVREALSAIGVSHSTLSGWRKSDEFCDLETRIPEFRKVLSREYLSIAFTRNFSMVLRRDENILRKALLVDTFNDMLAQKVVAGDMTATDAYTNSMHLTKEEQGYLTTLRKNYTPQQIDILDAVTTGRDNKNSNLSFAELVAAAISSGQQVQLSRTDTVKVANE